MRYPFPSRLTWAGLLLMAVAIDASGDTNEPMFAWRYRIATDFRPGDIRRVLLSPDVLSDARFFPADLRVRDGEGVDWPFYHLVPDTAPQVKTVRSRYRVVPPSGTSGVMRVEVTFPWYASEDMPPHNRVLIDWPESNEVLHLAEVSVGEHLQALHRQGDGYLVSRRDPVRVSNRVIDYAETTSRTLVVEIHPDAATRSRFPLPDAVEIYHQQPAMSSNQVLAVKIIEVRRPPDRAGTLSLIGDIGYSNLPLNAFTLDLDHAASAIPFSLYGGASTLGPWRWVAGGVLQPSLESGEADFAVHWPGYRFLKMDLVHFDLNDLAFEALNAFWAPQFLVVEARSDGPAYLFVGSDSYMLPGQALKYRISPEQVASAEIAGLRKREPNPMRIADRLYSYRAALLMTLGLLTLLLFALVALKSLRSRAG